MSTITFDTLDATRKLNRLLKIESKWEANP